VLTQHNILDPAKVLLTLLRRVRAAAKPVGPVQGQQVDRFLPGGGLAAFLEGQDIHPIKLLQVITMA